MIHLPRSLLQQESLFKVHTSGYTPDNSDLPDVRPKTDRLDIEPKTQVSSPAPRKTSGFEAEDLAALLMLHSACALGNVSAVKKLLAADGSRELVDACDELGSTALEKACLAGHEDVVQLLLAKGASAKGIPGAPSTPLHRTASLGDGPKTQRILKLLLDKDANPNIKDSSGRLAAELFEGTAGWQLSILQPGALKMALREICGVTNYFKDICTMIIS
eukprot:symbB.v1.2.031996.t1/scaffold3778.1/size50465/2